MGKLSKAIAKDIAKAHQESLNEGEGFLPNGDEEEFEDLEFDEEMADVLHDVFGLHEEDETLLGLEEEDEDWDEEEEEDDGLPSAYEIYMEVYDYIVHMGGFLLSQHELLESYPMLKQHRMFLQGAVLDCNPGNTESTISESFFNFWSIFDFRIGDSDETLGTVVKETVTELEQGDPHSMNFLDIGINSRMGFFQHLSTNEDGTVTLQELGFESEPIQAFTPWADDYQGTPGEVWFVRILPPLPNVAGHTIITTPYILNSECQDDCQKLLEKAALSEPRKKEAALYNFLKYGPTPNYWLDYLTKVPSVIDEERGVIFLKNAPLLD